jgi:hypothetical protein
MKNTYWFKWGKIGLSLMVFISLIVAIFFSNGNGWFDSINFLIVPMIPPMWVVSKLMGVPLIDVPIFNNLIIFLFFTLFFWFGVGVLIGWFYKKIKNRNSV